MAATQSGSFRALRILHNALLGGMLIFAGISFFLVKTDKFPQTADASFDRILQVVAVLISVMMLVIGFRLFKKRIFAARKSGAAAEEKLNLYRAACVGWWAMIEGPGLFALVGFLLTHNYAFFALACFHIVILAVFMPKRDNIVVLLNFSSDEISKLGDDR